MSTARVEFLATLRAGLRGLTAAQLEEVIADYGAHFDEASAAGREEREVAAALGDPLALAAELRVEHHISRWQDSPSPQSALEVVNSIGAAGILHRGLMSLALALFAALFLCALLASLILFGGGVWMAFAGASLDLPGGTPVVWLGCAGLMLASISLFAFTALAAIGAVNVLGRLSRVRYQLLTLPTPGKNP
jgi:uncharacterized membrane protein